jgi:hypothetical protein
MTEPKDKRSLEVDFLNSLLDAELERRIISLIGEGTPPERILGILLEGDGGD